MRFYSSNCFDWQMIMCHYIFHDAQYVVVVHHILICSCEHNDNVLYIIQICSGITRDRVLNGELYAPRLQKLIYLHL